MKKSTAPMAIFGLTLITAALSAPFASAHNGERALVTVNLVGPGQATNLLVRTGFHLTFNSNGELTAATTEDSVKCQ